MWIAKAKLLRTGTPAAVALSLLACPLHAAPKAPARPPAATAPPAKSPAASASLTIVSMTRGAQVFVDDILHGEVPLPEPLAISAGQTHTVRVQKRGYAPLVETVLLSAGQSKELEADLVPTGGILRVTSNVLRAQVLLSGQALGRTPFDGDVPLGEHTLQIAAPGYQTHAQPLVVRAGEAQDVRADLVPQAAPVARSDDRLTGKWWFWSAIGLAVVGGVAAGLVLGQDTQVAPPAPNGVLKL